MMIRCRPPKRLGTIVVFGFLLLLPNCSRAMEFSFKYGVMEMSGEIKTGDGKKFGLFLKSNLEAYRKSRRSVFLTSNGGNLIEALSIAAQLREIYPIVDITGKCASACFFIYLSSVKRLPIFGDLGIHRPYFDPRYFSELSFDKARESQALLTKTINSILEENEIPQKLIEIMRETSSADVYWLSTRERGEWIKFHPTWYEETLIARCNYGVILKLEKQRREARTKFEEEQIGKEIDKVLPESNKCEERIVDEELAKFSAKLFPKKR